jgi:hypothetical protein
MKRGPNEASTLIGVITRPEIPQNMSLISIKSIFILYMVFGINTDRSGYIKK